MMPNALSEEAAQAYQPLTSIEVVAPASALAGSTIEAQLKVSNLTTDIVYCWVTGQIFDASGNLISFLDNVALIMAGNATITVYGSFPMPTKATTIYGIVRVIDQWGQLVADDVHMVNIYVAPPPLPSGWDRVGKLTLYIEPSTTLPAGWDRVGKLTLKISPKTEINWLLIGGAVAGIGTAIALLVVLKEK